MKAADRKKRFNALAEYGCVVCRNAGYGRTWPEIHHICGHGYSGMGKRASDEHTIPLCPVHHRFSMQGAVAYHADPKKFEKRYGTQSELLDQVNRELDL